MMENTEPAAATSLTLGANEIREIAKKLDTEIYPQMRTNRRKHF